MKFHAKSSPPACGPTIYPSAVHDFLRGEAKHLVPYHRGDGQYAALRDGPVGGVDEARLLIEDGEGRVLVLGDGADGWALPRFAAAEDESAGILDVCNVMGSVLIQARQQLGLRLPWLSWLLDLPGSAPDGGGGERRCRVYGHRLSSAALLWMCVGAMANACHFFILDRAAPGTLFLIIGARSLAAAFSVNRKIMYAFFGLILVSFFYSYKSPLGFLGLFATIAATYGNFQMTGQRVRVFHMLSNVSWMVHNILVWTPVAALMEGAFLARVSEASELENARGKKVGAPHSCVLKL